MTGNLACIPAPAPSRRTPRPHRVVVSPPAPAPQRAPEPAPPISERREALYLLLVDLVADVRSATLEATFDAAVYLDRLKLTALAAFPA